MSGIRNGVAVGLLVLGSVTTCAHDSQSRIAVTRDGHTSQVTVRDLNVIRCDTRVCIVQFDPSGNPADVSGWTGTTSEATLADILGFSLHGLDS